MGKGMVRACAIIVAGGSGTRFGNPGGKLLIDVAGKPLITWTLEAFEAAERVGRIVVVCPPAKADEMRRVAVESFAFATPIDFAPSGVERQDSTRSGLAAVPDDFDIALVHDAARPLITSQTIDSAVADLEAAGRPVAGSTDGLDGVVCGQPAVDTLKVIDEDGCFAQTIDSAVADLEAAGRPVAGSTDGLDGVVCGQPAVDTLKVIDEDGCFAQTPPRSRFWTVQTPQVFWADSLRRAHEWAGRTGFAGTDDSSLVEGMGGRVRGFESPRDNLKVTLPEDLAPVEAALLARSSSRGV